MMRNVFLQLSQVPHQTLHRGTWASISCIFAAGGKENSEWMHVYGKDFLILHPLIKKMFAYVT